MTLFYSYIGQKPSADIESEIYEDSFVASGDSHNDKKTTKTQNARVDQSEIYEDSFVTSTASAKPQPPAVDDEIEVCDVLMYVIYGGCLLCQDSLALSLYIYISISISIYRYIY